MKVEKVHRHFDIVLITFFFSIDLLYLSVPSSYVIWRVNTISFPFFGKIMAAHIERLAPNVSHI